MSIIRFFSEVQSSAKTDSDEYVIAVSGLVGNAETKEYVCMVSNSAIATPSQFFATP